MRARNEIVIIRKVLTLFRKYSIQQKDYYVNQQIFKSVANLLQLCKLNLKYRELHVTMEHSERWLATHDKIKQTVLKIIADGLSLVSINYIRIPVHNINKPSLFGRIFDSSVVNLS